MIGRRLRCPFKDRYRQRKISVSPFAAIGTVRVAALEWRRGSVPEGVDTVRETASALLLFHKDDQSDLESNHLKSDFAIRLARRESFYCTVLLHTGIPENGTVGQTPD